MDAGGEAADFALFITSPGTSRAAEISHHYSFDGVIDRLTVFISGEIKRGDLEKIEQIYEEVERIDSEEPDADGFVTLPLAEARRRKAEWDEARRKGEAPPPSPPRSPLTALIQVNSVGGSVDEAMRRPLAAPVWL